MKLAFMSSVCPKMTLRELLSAGRSHGCEGIELRPEWDHAHGIELESTPAGRKEAAAAIADSGLEACCLSPGVKFCSQKPGDRDGQLGKLFQYIDLAAEVGIGRIRVFGDPLPNVGGGRRAANYHAQAEYLARAAERAQPAGVRLVLETRSPQEATGTRVEMAGGKMLRAEEAALRQGTIVTVRDLFFNVPARKKFLRSE